jgi:ABC-type nitrate/sulfonate/bicarbonate transport system permease component
MVIAELWVLQGTGELLSRFARAPRRLDLYYALVIIIVAFAVTVTEILKAVERRLRPVSSMKGTS